MITWLLRLHWRWKLAAALSGGLAIVVIGVAVLGGSSGSDPRRLMAVLSVLRRPYARQDALPAWAVTNVRSVTGPGQVWVPGLTRFVAAVPETTGWVSAAPGAERIFLTVFTPGTEVSGAARPFTSAGDVIGVTRLLTDHGAIFGPYFPASLLAGPGNALASATNGYEISVVPDGVTRVRWSFGSLMVSATVRDNVAIAPVNLESAQPTSATWYGRGGRVLETILQPRLLGVPSLPKFPTIP